MYGLMASGLTGDDVVLLRPRSKRWRPPICAKYAWCSRTGPYRLAKLFGRWHGGL
ncbi:hypothetical protein LP419_12670 [Massilia sp. H-1]|nr:hypothetical protein LP419_12670 [Massilia sp. H-1]